MPSRRAKPHPTHTRSYVRTPVHVHTCKAHTDPRAHTRAPAHVHTRRCAHPPADELVVGQPTRSAVPSLAPHPRLARTVLARYCVAPPALILTRIEVFCFRSTIDGLPSGAIAVSPYPGYSKVLEYHGTFRRVLQYQMDIVGALPTIGMVRPQRNARDT